MVPIVMKLCFILTLFFPEILAKNYFCDFSCGKIHTVCARPYCLPGSRCGAKFKMLPFTDEDRSVMLDLHNEARNYVASGNETRHGNGKAANINVLNWSKELEFVAQCWANNCQYDYDDCRYTKKFPYYVGQMISSTYAGTATDFTAHSYLNAAVLSWYNNIHKTNSSQIDSLPYQGSTTFTYLMGAKITHVGCGRVAYDDSSYMKIFIVCNYAPVMERGDSVYLRGEPCSKCSSCNKKYKALCGRIQDIAEDTWKHPFSSWIPSKEDDQDATSTYNRNDDQNTSMRITDQVSLLNLENILVNHINDFNHQQEKHQIEHNQQIDGLKNAISALARNNEIIVKQQEQLLQTLSRNNSGNV